MAACLGGCLQQPDIEPLEFDLQSRQLRDAGLRFGDLVRHQVTDRCPFGERVCLPAPDELFDLTQGQPERLGSLDELHAADGLQVVEPVPRLGPFGGAQQALLFVVADRAYGHRHFRSELADSELPRVHERGRYTLKLA